LAAQKSNEKISDILITYKANILDTDNAGRTAFHYACCGISSNVLNLLIGTKPEIVNLVDNNELSGLHYIILNSASKQVDMLRTILEHGGNVNARDKEGKTPIYYAAYYGKTRAIPLLL